MRARFVERVAKIVYCDEEDEKCMHEFKISLACGEDEIFDGSTYPCVHCGHKFVPNGFRWLWNTPSGKLEPGCLYWDYSLPEKTYRANHKGPHLMAILPDGNHWSIDSVASNCNRKDDPNAACWKRVGTPPDIHTMDCGCGAGAGSVWADMPKGWHGFLRHGIFEKC